MAFPSCVQAKTESVNITGASYPKAGNTYTYNATTSIGSVKSYSWSLSGANGASITPNGSKCSLHLSSGAKGYGTLKVVVYGNDGSSASTSYGVNIISNSTTVPTTTQRTTTTRVLNPAAPATTKKASSSSDATTKKQSETREDKTNPLKKESTATTKKAEKEIVDERTESETLNTTETTIAAVSEPVTFGSTETKADTLSLKITPNKSHTLFEWKGNNSDTYNLYLTLDGNNYFLVYSGTDTTYQIKHLQNNKTYTAVIEATNKQNDTITVSGLSDNIEFSL